MFKSHRVVGLQYSSGLPHLKVSCYSHNFSVGSSETLRFLRSINVGNWSSGECLNWQSFDDYVRYLWHVNGVDWVDQSDRQKNHLKSLLRRFPCVPTKGTYVGSRLYPCVRTIVLYLPSWLQGWDGLDTSDSCTSEEVHEIVDDSSDGEVQDD